MLVCNFKFTYIYSVCLSVLKHASAKYATNAFSSKMKDEKLVAWFTFSKKHIIWSRCYFAEDGKEMYNDL